MARLAFVVVGHVDHGKSTLIGRLLADTGALPDGRVEKVRQICEAQRKPFEYAFLLDALEAEQLQGVTIDITEVRFTWQGRDYFIIDAPGHKEFMKNMITGAAHADAALLVVDAREGVQEQSYRHAYLLSFLGVRPVAVVVTKMDLVDYGQEVFERIRAEYRRFLEDLKIRPVGFVPVSAVGGDNVTARTSRMPWYDGSPVLDLLADLRVPDETRAGRLRLPVQDVYKFDERRIIAGRLEAGRIAVSDEIQVWLSGHRARVKSIERWPETTEPLLAAEAKASVGITLDYQLFVQRGDVLADPAHPPRVSNFVAANVFWFGRAPLELNRTYRLKLATLERDVEVCSITRVLSPVTMEVDTDRAGIGQNEAGEIVLRSVRPFVFDVAADSPTTGRFVLLDGLRRRRRRHRPRGGRALSSSLPSEPPEERQHLAGAGDGDGRGPGGRVRAPQPRRVADRGAGRWQEHDRPIPRARAIQPARQGLRARRREPPLRAQRRPRVPRTSTGASRRGGRPRSRACSISRASSRSWRW